MMQLFLPTKQEWVRKELENYKIPTVNDTVRNKYGKNGNTCDFLLFLLDQALNEQVWTQGASESIFSLLSRIVKDNRGICNVEEFLPQFFHFIYAVCQLLSLSLHKTQTIS